jgi:oxygen-independent coproporphyrinogen III oxidase
MTDVASPTEEQGIRYYPVIKAAEAATQRHAGGSGPIAIYLHIPFCENRCHFCEFAIVTGKRVTDTLMDEYVAAVKREMLAFAQHMEDPASPITTVQLGGGTPTSLSAPALDELIDFIFSNFNCSDLQDVIIEGFPASITRDRLEVLRRIPGIKLNIGVQSFDAECRSAVGRGHDADPIMAIERALDAGIESLGIDLILGLPCSSLATVTADLDIISRLGVRHLACYPLWVYGRTALGIGVKRGSVRLPDEVGKYKQLEVCLNRLPTMGFDRYTAFHYSASEADRHQYGIWQMLARDWVGFGMSSMSFLGNNVFINDRSIRRYIDKTEAGQLLAGDGNHLGLKEQMRFVLLYGLRLRRYPRSTFEKRFSRDVLDVFAGEMALLKERGLVTIDDQAIDLTPEGIMHLGEIEALVHAFGESVNGVRP